MATRSKKIAPSEAGAIPQSAKPETREQDIAVSLITSRQEDLRPAVSWKTGSKPNRKWPLMTPPNKTRDASAIFDVSQACPALCHMHIHSYMGDQYVA